MNETQSILLEGADGSRLALRVVGYQFQSTKGSIDDDWLVIEGSVVSASASWSFRDPCLTVGELEQLASWLEQLRDGHLDKPSTLSFIEPNLEFQVAATSPALVRVFFKLEARPTRSNLDEDRMANDVWIDVDASPAALAPTIGLVRGALRRFPHR